MTGFFSDPAGTRTQGPYIKSVLLYQLSYGINRMFFSERDAKIKVYFLLPKKNEKKYLLPPITLYSKGFQVIYFHLLRFQSLIS